MEQRSTSEDGLSEQTRAAIQWLTRLSRRNLRWASDPLGSEESGVRQSIQLAVSSAEGFKHGVGSSGCTPEERQALDSCTLRR